MGDVVEADDVGIIAVLAERAVMADVIGMGVIVHAVQSDLV